MKYLIAGLGNIGPDYVHTRHNIGFDVVENLAANLGVTFSTGKKVTVAEARHKGRSLIIIKPTTFMNLSGEAIRFWLQDQKIPIENLLVITDDLALPFGSLRMRPAGSSAGHNGITNIIECLNTDKFPRLRFGIGSDYPKGRQIDYVLGRWTNEEEAILPEKLKLAEDFIKSFVTMGIQPTMNALNKK